MYRSGSEDDMGSRRSSMGLTVGRAVAGTALIVAAGAGAWILTRVRTSKSNEWLVRTGLFAPNVQVGKTFVQWPFQRVRPVSMEAHTFKIVVTSMTSEKLSIDVPMTWSVAVGDTPKDVAAFATRVSEEVDAHTWTTEVIKPVLMGESRAIAANLGVEDVFKARDSFAQQIKTNVSAYLSEYGIVVLNASVTELADSGGSKYFKALAETISAQAHNKAVAEVAAADRDGKMAAKAREGETRTRTAQIEADTKTAEGANDQAVLKVQAAVAVTKSEQELLSATARINAAQNAAKLEQERLTEVARASAARATEEQRSKLLAPAIVAAEIARTEAEGKANAVRIAAAAQLEKARAEGDAIAYAGEKSAHAAKAMLDAQAQGVQNILTAFGGDSRAAVAYLALEKGTWGELARAQAAALQGLNPRITVWAPDGKAATDPFRQLGGSLPPLFDALSAQMGLDVPALLKGLAGGAGASGSGAASGAATDGAAASAEYVTSVVPASKTILR